MISIILFLVGIVIGFALGRVKNAAKLSAANATVSNLEAKLKAEALKAEAYLKAKL